MFDGVVPSALLPVLTKDEIEQEHGARGLTFPTANADVSKRISLVIPGRLLCECIEQVLHRPDRVVSGDCASLEQLLGEVDHRPAPDVIIVAVAAPEASASFAAIRTIRQFWPSTRWIALSTTTGLDFIRDAVMSGIDGFLLDGSPVEVLRLLVELVLLGHSPLPIELAHLLAPSADALADQSDSRSAVPLAALTGEAGQVPEGLQGTNAIGRGARTLSDRELDILGCLAQGQSNKMIARELSIAEATVKVHVKALLRKMKVANRTQAAIRAPLFLDVGPRGWPAPSATVKLLAPAGAVAPAAMGVSRSLASTHAMD